MASKTKLTKADYIKTGMRAYYIQNGFNYGNYQGLGYANMLFPALKKMYKGDDDALQAALQDNIEFYNTNLHFVPFITSLHLAMLENDANPTDIRQIKMALMGPLAGVGDSLSQFILAPLLGTIGASLAFEGQMSGVFVYLLGMNITLFIIKYLSALLGYNVGTKVIGTLTESINKIASVASMNLLMRTELVLSVTSNLTTQAFLFFSSLWSMLKTRPSMMTVPMSMETSFMGTALPLKGFP